MGTKWINFTHLNISLFSGKFAPFLETVAASTSVFTIIGISIERFRVVYRPLSSTDFRYKPTLCAIVFIWCLSICISLPMFSLIVYKSSLWVDGTPIKVCRLYPSSQLKKCYVVTYSVLVYAIPVILLFILYTKVIGKFRSVAGNSIEFSENYRCSQERYRIRKQVIHIIICVILVFFICHLPFRVISLVLMFSNPKAIRSLGLETYLSLVNYSRCLLYMNHALNPILYNFMSRKFRSAFRHMVFKRSRSYTDKRNQSPRKHFLTQKERTKRVVFKRKSSTPSGSESQNPKRDRDQSSSSSETQRQNRRNKYLLHFVSNSNPEVSDDSKLLSHDDSGSYRRRDDCINIEVNNKSSTKVRFVMTKDGYVIGISLHKIKRDNKDFDSYD